MGKNYRKELESLKEDDNKQIDKLVDEFLDELKVDGSTKKAITDILAQLKKHSFQSYWHSIYVAFRTYDLARKFVNQNDSFYSLTEKEFQELCIAALLHDAGKLDIDLEILEKRGGLEPEEVAIMQTHSSKTRAHLEGFSENIIDLAVHHHEKLNGNGYPDKLNANKITLSMRILAVADITSALLQKRAYKNALSTDKTAAILKEGIDKQELDRVVGEKMIDMLFLEDRLKELEDEETKNQNQ